MSAPCLWPADYACLPTPETEADSIAQQQAVDTAVAVLWAFTGRQYGCCPRIVRPCPSPDSADDVLRAWLPGTSWYPELDGGVWRNIGCGCDGACAVRGPGVVHLPGPVCSIEEVVIDGAWIDTDLYVLEGDRLYATSGRWPAQDLTRPAGSPGTWSVTYGQGLAPPAGAAQMVGLLAAEFVKARCGDKTCRLPKGVESITRNGVAIRMSDPSALFRDQLTGLPEVDMWVSAINPHRLAVPPVVSSPDYPSRGVM